MNNMVNIFYRITTNISASARCGKYMFNPPNMNVSETALSKMTVSTKQTWTGIQIEISLV